MRYTIERNIWFVLGIIINSFGIALITKADLGTSPITSVAYVVSLASSFSLGQVTFVVNMVFILVQIILLKKEFHPIQFLQIVVNVIFSLCIDVSMSVLSWLKVENFAGEFLILIAGCIILGFGICVEVAPDILVVPGEGIVRAISKVSKKKFGTIKNIFDITLVVIAALLSFIFWGRLNGLGLGTIVSAICVGRVVSFINSKSYLISYINSLKQKQTELSLNNKN